MATVFQRIQTPGIAQISYLIGDDGSATAAVIDPRPDVDVYLELPQISVHELKDRLHSLRVLDVRWSPQEWKRGHVPGANHLFVAEMRDGRNGVADLSTCGPSGYRASIAASMLQRRGFTDVRNVPGSWQAWTKAGYEVER